MNEYETDPQRPPTNSDAEQSHPTAEMPSADRGQSDSAPLTSEPSVSDAAWARPSNGPSAPEGTGSPGSPAAPASDTSPETAEAPTAPIGTPTPFGPPPAHPMPGQPVGAAPAGSYAPSPWHPAYAQQNQPGWTAGNPSYPGFPGPQGQHMPGSVPPPAPHLGGGAPPPPWLHGPGEPRPAPGGGRLGKFAAIGAAALVLMVGSGIAGGVVALATNNDTPAGISRTFNAAPVLNRDNLPQIANKVQDSVVSIMTANAEGSGVVMSDDGYVLTNNHVVADATGGTVKVIFADGKSATAKIIGADAKTDLAVIKADGVSGLVAAKFGDSDAMQVGDTVLALGSPLGLQGSVTAGIISARDRTIQTGDEAPDPQQGNPFSPPQQQAPVTSISGLLQTDAPINHGNSGGALVNTNGEVIGINNAIATSGQSDGSIGLGFAIPSNKAKAVADALRQGKKVSHPSLGVGVGDTENGGAGISSVTPGSPAEKAGLERGDIVTKFAGKAINSANDLVSAVQAGKVGDQVQLTYTRNGAEKTATVTLAEAS